MPSYLCFVYYKAVQMQKYGILRYIVLDIWNIKMYYLKIKDCISQNIKTEARPHVTRTAICN